MVEGPCAIVRHGPALPIDVWQLVMDALYEDSSPEDHCYRNQRTYHTLSLVCQAWRMHAQSLLFRIVELTDPASLRKFSAHLDFAPHLALYVRSLRVYSRYLFTPDNVFALLPDEIDAKLPNLRALAVTRISNVDSWHPLSSLPLSPAELPYVPLSQDFPTRLAPVCHVTTLKLYFVSFPCFCELARIVRAFHNLRVLAIIEVHWKFYDPPAFMLKTAADDERDAFLPNIEDLTLSWLDEYGPEHILAALGPSGASSLTHLYVDCPMFDPPSSPDDQHTSGPLCANLSHCAGLRDLWVSVPHPLTACPSMADAFAALLASWAPTCVGEERTLTLTPTFESDFTRAQFVDVLRVLGPVTEHQLLDREEEEADEGAEVVICVIDRAEKHAWWAETVARECFPRMYARGRVRAAFWKRYWDDCVWSDDCSAGAVESPPADTDADADVPATLNANADTDAPAPDVTHGREEDEDADDPTDTPPLGPVASESDTAARTADGSSVPRPPRGARRSLKKRSGLVLTRVAKLVRALVRRTS